MSKNALARAKFAAALCVALAGAFGLSGIATAQQSAPPAQAQPATPAAPAGTPAAPSAAPSAPPATATAPATPSTPTPLPLPATPGQTTPTLPAQAAPAAPAQAAPAAPPTDNAPADAASQTLELVAHPAAYVEGKATWDEGFAAINSAFAQINGELAKANLKSAGRPIAVFDETDDTSFKYRAMIPIDAAPADKSGLTDAVKFGQTPAGKAMKFEHRGSYEDIDSTYEAITAYLDEKGLEAQNLFYEEYLNDVKTPDDPTLEVDIYVLLK